MATIQVIDPGVGNDIYTNLNTAFSAARDFDKVVISFSGTYIMTGNITTPYRVSLQGPGYLSLIIKRSESSTDSAVVGWGSMIRWNINSIFPCYVNISGITFRSKLPSANDGSDGLSLAKDLGIRFDGCVGFRVHDCEFDNFGDSGIQVNHLDTYARGLIDHNIFNHNAKGADGQGYGYGITVYGEGKDWITNVNFGTQNFIFVESNTFKYHRHSIAGAGGSLYVFRNNNCDFNIIGGPYIHCVDGHGGRGPGNGINTTGARGTEVYNNTLVNSTCVDGVTLIGNGQNVATHVEHCIGIFGGESVIFGNAINGYRFGVAIEQDHYTTAYPNLDQPGYISGRRKGAANTDLDTIGTEGDMFVWSNNFTAHTYPDAFPTSGQYFYNYNDLDPNSNPYFVNGRDFHFSTDATAKRQNYSQFAFPHPDILI